MTLLHRLSCPPATRLTARRRSGIAVLALAALIAPVAAAAPAYASSTANEIVYVEDVDGDGQDTVMLRDLTTGRTTTVLGESTERDAEGFTNEVEYGTPQLSPDATTIVLSTNRGTSSVHEVIATVGRDGTGFRSLTPAVAGAEHDDIYPAWSPDGSRVLFTRTALSFDNGTLAVDSELRVVPASGGGSTLITGAEDGFLGDWSPDGTKVVFAALSPNAIIEGSVTNSPLTITNADGSGGRTALGPRGATPTWSPDGKTIAYTAQTSRDGAVYTSQIAVVAAAGGTGRLLGATKPSSAPSIASTPSWLPDSQSLVYDFSTYDAAGEETPADLWAVDVTGVRAARIVATPGSQLTPFAHGPAPSSVVPGTSSEFVPVTPKRILDTRPGSGNVGAPAAKIGPGGTVKLAIRGVSTSSGTVSADATAVVLNVTVTRPTASTDVRVYPSGGAGVPTVSNLNAPAGSTVANLVTTAIGPDGAVVLRNSAGTVDLIADIAGFYVPADLAGSNAVGFTAMDPSRILDTRSGLGARGERVGAGQTIDLQVTGTLSTVEGTTSVPADATAVVLNVTGTGVTASTDVRVYPTGTATVPTVSNLNLARGQTAPNLVTVAVGEGGKVRLRNQAGELHLIADIAGYYSPGSTGRFVPVAPQRFLDTRSGVGAAPVPTGAGGVLDVAFAGHRGISSQARAVVLNVTATGVSASTDVRAYPTPATAAVPTVSNLNLTRGTTRANAAIVKTGDGGRVRLRNTTGELSLIADVAGYMVG